MSSLDLKTVNAKIARAKEHFGTLQVEYTAWFQSDPYELLREVNADATRHSVRVRVRHRPNCGHLGATLADLMHNARCALDHLTHAIAAQQHAAPGALSDETLRHLNFVIADNPADFARAMKREELVLLSPPVQAAIESVQPYKRRHAAGMSLLAMLRKMDNADKHRLIHTTFAALGQIKFHIRNLLPGQTAALVERETSDVEDNTELGAFTISSPAPQVKYEFEAPLAICVRHDGLHAIDGFADALIMEVSDVVKIVYDAV